LKTALPAATSNAIGVLIADSNGMQAQLLISALRRRPEFRISTCRMEGQSILNSVAAIPAEVAVLSLNGVASIAENMSALHGFHLSHPAIAKVLLMESCDRELVVGAFRSGARGIFCVTDSPFRDLCKCIHRVARGQVWANTLQMNYLLDSIVEVPSIRVFNARGDKLLTPREEQVVALVSEGLSNRQVARELVLSEHTVKKYLFHVFDKLGISTRVELVLYAVSHGHPATLQYLAGATNMSRA
jgi:DNA-binding NarL/FixJ family response regulator